MENTHAEWKNIWMILCNESSIAFASGSISMSQRPMKLNVGVSAGQCRPESIYLHTSTGLVEARLWASHILASLKTQLQQAWVNGLLMDTQRQVLFLLAGALDKAKGCSLTESYSSYEALQNLQKHGGTKIQSGKLAVMQFKRYRTWGRGQITQYIH